MKDLDIVILAAGKGERMASRKPKVMHEIMGKPLLGYVVDAARTLEPARIVVVTGYGRETVEAYLEEKDVATAFQETQKGTAHALASARGHLEGNDVLVLPATFLSSRIRHLFSSSNSAGPLASTSLTTDVTRPFRVRAGQRGRRHHADIRRTQTRRPRKLIPRINTGICYIPFQDLGPRPHRHRQHKGERYLTDIRKVARAQATQRVFHLCRTRSSASIP